MVPNDVVQNIIAHKGEGVTDLQCWNSVGFLFIIRGLRKIASPLNIDFLFTNWIKNLTYFSWYVVIIR